MFIIFFNYLIFSLSPRNRIEKLEKHIHFVRIKSLIEEKELQGIMSRGIDEKVIHRLENGIYSPHQMPNFVFQLTYDSKRKERSREVSSVWLYTFFATQLIKEGYLYEEQTILTSLLPLYLPRYGVTHKRFRAIRIIKDWEGDLCQPSFLGNIFDMLKHSYENEVYFKWILKDCDLNQAQSAMRIETPEQADFVHSQIEMESVRNNGWEHRTLLEGLIGKIQEKEQKELYNMIEEFISRSDLKERLNDKGQNIFMFFLDNLRKKNISFQSIRKILQKFILSGASLWQQDNEGETAFSILNNSQWNSIDLQKKCLEEVNSFLKNNSPLPFHYLLQNFKGEPTGASLCQSKKKRKDHKKTSILLEDPLFEPSYQNTHFLLSHVEKRETMIEFFLNVARVCPVIETAKSEMRQQSTVHHLVEILCSKKEWFSQIKAQGFWKQYTSEEIPYDALIWLFIIVLQRKDLTEKQRFFCIEVLKEVKKLNTSWLSEQAQVYLSLIKEEEESFGELDIKKVIQAIINGENLFIIILGLREDQAEQLQVQWVEKGVGIPFYNPRNVVLRASFLALQQACSSAYGKKEYPLYQKRMQCIQKEKEQMQDNKVMVSSSEEILKLMGQEAIENKEGEVEGRSFYLNTKQGQIVVKFETNSDDEKGMFIDGALINYGHHQKINPICDVYGLARAVQLSDEFFETIKGRIQQQEKFKKSIIENNAVVFFHPNYQDRILKERRKGEKAETSAEGLVNKMETFKKRLVKNLEDYLDLANSGLLFEDLTSYSHGVGLDGEKRSYDEAVYLDVIDIRNHGKGTITDLVEGVKDSNLGIHGFVDPGNIFQAQVHTESYNKDNKKLFEKISEKEKERRFLVQYSKVFMGYLQSHYVSWLVFLTENSNLLNSLETVDLVEETFQLIIQPFIEKMLSSYNNEHGVSYLKKIIYPLIYEDMTYLLKFNKYVGYPILRDRIRDFCLQNVFTACSFLVSLLNLEVKGVSIVIPQMTPNNIVKAQTRREKNRKILMEYVRQKNTKKLIQNKSILIEEIFWMKEYYLFKGQTEYLIVLIDIAPKVFTNINEEEVKYLFRSIYFWKKELILDAIFFNNLEVIQYIYKKDKELILNIKEEMMLTVLMRKNQEVLFYMIQHIPQLWEDKSILVDWGLKESFKKPESLDFLKNLLKYYFSEAPPLKIVEILYYLMNKMDGDELCIFLKDQEIYSQVTFHKISLPSKVMKSLHQYVHLFSKEIIEMSLMEKWGKNEVLIEMQKALYQKEIDRFLEILEKKSVESYFYYRILIDFLSWTTVEEWKKYMPRFLKATVKIKFYSCTKDDLNIKSIPNFLEKIKILINNEKGMKIVITEMSQYLIDETENSEFLVDYLLEHMGLNEQEKILENWIPPTEELQDKVISILQKKGWNSEQITEMWKNIFENLFKEIYAPEYDKVVKLKSYYEKIKEKMEIDEIALFEGIPKQVFIKFSQKHITMFFLIFPSRFFWKYYPSLFREKTQLECIQQLFRAGVLKVEDIGIIISKIDYASIAWLIRQDDRYLVEVQKEEVKKVIKEKMIEKVSELFLKFNERMEYSDLIELKMFIKSVWEDPEKIKIFFDKESEGLNLESEVEKLNQRRVFLEGQQKLWMANLKQSSVIGLESFLSYVYIQEKLIIGRNEPEKIDESHPLYIRKHLENLKQSLMSLLEKVNLGSIEKQEEERQDERYLWKVWRSLKSYRISEVFKKSEEQKLIEEIYDFINFYRKDLSKELFKDMIIRSFLDIKKSFLEKRELVKMFLNTEEGQRVEELIEEEEEYEREFLQKIEEEEYEREFFQKIEEESLSLEVGVNHQYDLGSQERLKSA